MSMSDTSTRGSRSPAGDHWEATRAQTALATQVMRDEKDEVAVETRDIGRLVGNDQRELFVSCGPAEAMRQQFEIIRPEFVALHDLGISLSRKLLAGLAAASGRNMQKLVVRRQGYGTPLATLEFIEWPTAQGGVLRLYTTQIDSDSASRSALALTLLGHSHLAVVMVGELPAHALASALQPLQHAMQRGAWPNRHMLLLPLSSASALASHGSTLAGHSGVTVRTTPQVTRPTDAWAFITGTWNHLHEQPSLRGMQLPGLVTAVGPAAKDGGEAVARPVASSPVIAATPVAAAPPLEAVTTPLPLRPMPAVPQADAPAPRLEDVLAEYVERVAKLNGLIACCVFEIGSARTRAYAGTRLAAQDLAQQGRALLDCSAASGHALGMSGEHAELALSLDAVHLVLRPLPGHPRLVLHAALDKTLANLTLARLQIQRLDEDLCAATS